MMKQRLTLLFVAITLTVCGQKNQAVELRWKIEKNGKLNYLTIMSDIDTSSIEMDFGGLFNALSDSSDNGLKKSKDLLNQLNKEFKKQDFVTTLTNKGNGVIDIVMTTRPKEPAEETAHDTTDSNEAGLLKMMQSISQGVMLRGSVYETGGIHSFWIKSAQKNLLATFFELPKKPVKVGDIWSLDINFIANDQNFECDTSYKINEVMLVDIRKINGETIAVLKYNISEYVKGDFHTPSFFGSEGEQKETMMRFSHQGVAEFSIDKGRWVSYDAIMSLETTGVMLANKKTKFALIDENSDSR